MYGCQWYDTGTFLICVDSYQERIPQGHLYHPVTSEAVDFSGLVQMLLNMEQMMDVENLPQVFQKLRSFGPQPNADGALFSVGQYTRGLIASICVQVRFRRNAGWQGTLYWSEGKQTQHFRSVLELITLLDSALRPEQSNAPWDGTDSSAVAGEG